MTWNDIITAIVTSLIASVVFWLVFNVLPNTWERRKIKPLLDFDLYQIYSRLAHFLEIPFYHSMHSPSYSQMELYSGGLNKEDYHLYLATKCLTEDYKNVDDMAKNLMPIGHSLKATASQILDQIQKIYVFNRYLTAEQILLCRKIAGKLTTYDFEMKPFMKVGNQVLGPVDPSMRGMESVFYETYLLFLLLQKHLISRKPKDNELGDIYKELAFRELALLYRQGKYKKAAKKAKITNDNNTNSYYFRSMLRKGDIEIGLVALREFVQKSSMQLIYMRGYFKEFKDDEQIKKLLIETRSENEYQEMMDCIKEEEEQKMVYKQFATELAAFYDNKLKNKMRGV